MAQQVTEVVTATSYLSLTSSKSGGRHRWALFFGLIFRHSACQHPLIASAIARMVADKSSTEVVVSMPGALQQILSMTLSNSLHVSISTCSSSSISCSGSGSVVFRRCHTHGCRQELYRGGGQQLFSREYHY